MSENIWLMSRRGVAGKLSVTLLQDGLGNGVSQLHLSRALVSAAACRTFSSTLESVPNEFFFL